MSNQPPSLFDPNGNEPSPFEPKARVEPRAGAEPRAGGRPPAGSRAGLRTPAGRRPRTLGFPLAVIAVGVLLGALAVLALVVTGVYTPGGSGPDSSAPVATITEAADARPNPGPARSNTGAARPSTDSARPVSTTPRAQTAILGDGIYLVGPDVQPGTYVTTDRNAGCRWARLGAFTGGERRVLAQGTGQSQAQVTVRAGDAAFRTTGCRAWQRR